MRSISKLVKKLILLIAVSAPASIYAHHSRAMFNLEETLALEGTISKATWRNPHVYFEIDAVSGSGASETWTLESVSVALLARAGWTAETLKVGDRVIATINPHKDYARRYGELQDVALLDGTSLKPATVADLTRADIDGVTPSTDFSGTWTTANPRNRDGTVGNEALSGPTQWPLTEQGRLQVQTFDVAEDPMFDCVFYGVPRLATSIYSRRWTREPGRIVIQQEQYPITRVIYLDGSSRPEDFSPNPVGFSTGRIESDGTLVVETDAFSYTPWGSAAGLDSSERKRVIEEYKLSEDGLQLYYSHTLIDPEFLTAPVTAGVAYTKILDHEYVYETCDPESARIPLER